MLKLISKILLPALVVFALNIKSQTTTKLHIQDEQANGLPGAHVLLKNINQYYLSDENGELILITNVNDTLQIEVSFIGFKTKYIKLIPGKTYTIKLDEDLLSLNTFVVTGQYAKNNPEKAVQRITIIDKEKIEKMAAINLKDVLTNEMNIRLTQDNILGSGLSLQGISGENVKILIDGVPVIGRLNGNIDLSQINLNDIERIEIIEGPMSVNYGSNALAGVINLITKKNVNKSFELTANSYYENVGNYNFDGLITFKKKKNNFTFLGGRNYFDGWVETDLLFKEKSNIADSSRFKTWKPKEQIFGKFKYFYQLNNGSFHYTFNYFDEKITNKGIPRPPYYESAFDEYYYTTRIDNSINLNKDFDTDKHFKIILSYNNYLRIKNRFYKDLTTLEEVQTENSGDQDTTKFNQWVLRSNYSTSKDSAKINFQVGVDFNIENAYGKRIENNLQQIGDYATYVSFEYKPFKNTIIRPGVRYSYNTKYNAPVTPSINIKQSLKKFNFRASYAKGFRSPSIKQLYLLFVDINHNILGNENLKAEQSNNFNFSVNRNFLLTKAVIKNEISLFYNHIYNLVTLAQINSSQFSYINLGEFQSKGIQYNGNLLFNNFNFNYGVSIIGRENYLADSLNIEKFNYYPEYKINLSYTTTNKQWVFSLFYKYNGKINAYYLDENNNIYQSYISDYSLADAIILKNLFKKHLQISVGSKNIFNVKNIASNTQNSAHSGNSNSTIVGMGRTYFLKVKFTFSHD